MGLLVWWALMAVWAEMVSLAARFCLGVKAAWLRAICLCWLCMVATAPQRDSTSAIHSYDIIIIKRASINSTVFVVAPATLRKHWSWRKLLGFTFLGKNVGERIPIPTPHLFHRPFSLLHQPLNEGQGLKSKIISGSSSIMQFCFWVFCPLCSEIIAGNFQKGS